MAKIPAPVSMAAVAWAATSSDCSMSKDRDNKKEVEVRQRLRAAFANVPCPDDFRAANACGPVLHSVCLELRRDFYNYESEEIHYLLPFILEDMMDTRKGSDIETEDAELLIMQLNPKGSGSEIVERIRTESFSRFTPEQSQAVCEWLRLARGWDDLSRFTDYVDASIEYWCGRAAIENL